MKLKIKKLCIITSTGVCHIHYLISLHLPMIFFLIEQDKRAVYVLSLALLKELHTVYSVIIWNVITTFF